MTVSPDRTACTWLLLAADGGVLAELEIRDTDQPWYHCHFRPYPRFAFVARLFEQELRLLETGQPFDWDEWNEAYDRIRALRLRMQRGSGGLPTREFVLHATTLDFASL